MVLAEEGDMAFLSSYSLIYPPRPMQAAAEKLAQDRGAPQGHSQHLQRGPFAYESSTFHLSALSRTFTTGSH